MLLVVIIDPHTPEIRKGTGKDSYAAVPKAAQRDVDGLCARLLELGESLVAVVLNSFDEGIVGRQRSKGATHVRVDNLQAVDVAGIDPAEPIFFLHR